MQPSAAFAAQREARRRNGLLGYLFVKQLAVVQHPSRRKAVLTPRRAGKTVLVCIWLLHLARQHPGEKCLYLALTRPSGADIAWGIFKQIDKLFSLGCHFHESKLHITLPNGALIMVRGADQPNWIDRLEGQEFLLVVVDEAASFNISLRRLVYMSLVPMVAREGSSLVLIGRPGEVQAGLFWEVTRPDEENREKGWEVFTWSTFDNPHMADAWRRQIDELIAANPAIEETPGFRANYYGEWTTDRRFGVYSGFNPLVNLFPPGHVYAPHHTERFVGALDFGWNDRSALGVGAYNDRDPFLTYLESWAAKEVLLTEICERINVLKRKYPGLIIYGDPARKQLLMEVQSRFGQMIQIADKIEKRDCIDLCNTEMSLGRVKVIRETNQGFIDEIQKLRRYYPKSKGDEHEGDWIENPKQPNDYTDVFLYTFRHSYHYRYMKPVEQPQPGTREWNQWFEDKMEQEEAERHRSKRDRQWWAR